HTKRREFITLLGGAAAWPLAARAQRAPKTSRLGVLLFSTPQADPQMETARRALRDLGYVEGQNLAIEYRSAEGQPERLPDLAADLVRMKPDVLFALGGDVTRGRSSTRTQRRSRARPAQREGRRDRDVDRRGLPLLIGKLACPDLW